MGSAAGAFVCQRIGRRQKIGRSFERTTVTGAKVRKELLPQAACHTMYDMKSSAVTIRLEPELQKLLDKVCKESGRTRSDVLRDALKRQLGILRFEKLRRQMMPFAEAAGYLTDEDIFKAIS